MNCPHCMDDARCDSDKFMTFDTFKKAVEFNNKYDFSMTITGGEPTEHPQFWEFIEYAVENSNRFSAITVASNGQNLDEDTGELKEKILQLAKKCKGYFAIQITSVLGLYPTQVNLVNPIFHIEPVIIATEIEAMYPQGRAKGKDYDFSKIKGPKCFNIRSGLRSGQSFGSIIHTLRSIFKFCTPQIGYDGSLKVGESTLCPPVSHIDKPIEEIEKDIRDFRCQGCKELLEPLSVIHKAVIGEL